MFCLFDYWTQHQHHFCMEGEHDGMNVNMQLQTWNVTFFQHFEKEEHSLTVRTGLKVTQPLLKYLLMAEIPYS